MDKRIKKLITRTRIWVFLKNILSGSIYCLMCGVGIAMIFEIIAYFTPWYLVHYFSMGIIILSFLASLLYAVIRFPSEKDAAKELDKSGLEERAQTAIELLGQDSMFATIQKRDAYRAMLGDKLSKMIPLEFKWKQSLVVLSCGFIMIVFAMLPSNAKDIAAQKYEVASVAKEEAAKVEKVQDELKDEISAQEKAEYEETLRNIISELKDASTQEEIDKSLERAKTKLEQMAEKTKSEKAKEAMSELAKSIDADRKNGTDNGQDNEVLAEVQKLDDMLSDVNDLSELSDEEKKELLEQLENLKDIAASKMSDEELQSLSELASQITSGQSNNQALASAKATVSGLKAAQMLASNPGDNNSNNSSNNGNNSNNGNSNGNGNGNGSGNGNGNGNGSGNGSGSGSGNGSGNGSGHGGGWNYGSKEGKESDDIFGGDMVSIPNETGDDENLTGQNSQGETYLSHGGPSISWTGRQVEYSSVFAQYKQKALSSIENGTYPSGVQDIIKSYFEKISN